jgi:hypothetical protein
VAENPPEKKNGQGDLEDEQPVFAHAEGGELHDCVRQVETLIVQTAWRTKQRQRSPSVTSW